MGISLNFIKEISVTLDKTIPTANKDRSPRVKMAAKWFMHKVSRNDWMVTPFIVHQ